MSSVNGPPGGGERRKSVFGGGQGNRAQGDAEESGGEAVEEDTVHGRSIA